MVRVWPLAKDQRISCIYFVHAAFLGASLGLTKFHLRSCCLFYQMRSLVNSYSFLLERKLLSIFNWLMPKTFIPLHTMVSELIIMTRIMFKTEPTFFRVGQGGRGVVVYQYTQKKFAKIPPNTQNSFKYTQN